MAVKMKRSGVAGKMPTTAQLALGELAVNTYDGRLFLKKDDGTEAIVEIVNSGRLISAGTGLTGGGSLAANRTLSADIASQVEAEAGTLSTKLMTPERVAQAITALAQAGGGISNLQVFTASGTYTKSPGVTKALVILTGGGEGGGEGSYHGACGTTLIKLLDLSAISSATITVGSGGISTSGTNGSNGGNTVWSDGTNTLTALGGTGAGRTPTGGDLNIHSNHYKQEQQLGSFWGSNGAFGHGGVAKGSRGSNGQSGWAGVAFILEII